MPVENLQLFGAVTYQKATYEEGSYDGNWIPAIPKYILKAGAEYAFPFGTVLRCQYNDVGKWYTSKSNSSDYGGYQVLDLRISQRIADNWTVSFDAKNLFDETYSEYVSNWSGTNQYAGSDGSCFLLSVRYSK